MRYWCRRQEMHRLYTANITTFVDWISGHDVEHAITAKPHPLQLLFFHCIDSLFKTAALFEMGLKARKGLGGECLDIGILRIL